ncbi:hypothetical protein B0H63DRAFT_55417 [Podospora didyma]|uniref:BTB domain-containing protein n=1 Tax=Podospora didyma TaxID=330526 RepID=A0AAE0U8B5_9PEZI|nr:hypothetical protein B0H63DRAFT_55417 [Podospora didyma]
MSSSGSNTTGIAAAAASSSNSSGSGSSSSNNVNITDQVGGQSGEGNSNSSSGSSSGSNTNANTSSHAGTSSRYQRNQVAQTLDDVMRAPSSTLPDVVVLDSLPEGLGRKENLDPKEDLWLSTADGRYSTAIIPLRVGEAPYIETFYVHKHILLKSEYFEKALCGEFRESIAQSIDLPDENPAIFHFLVAYLYEGKYDPIKPVASVLIPDEDKGKGREVAPDTGAESDSDDSVGSYNSDISAVSRRRRDRRRRREERHWERMRQKHPGMHRPNCNCPQCLSASGPPCWHCQAPRAPPPPVPMPHHHPGVVVVERDIHTRVVDRGQRRAPRRRHNAPPGPAPLTPPEGRGWVPGPADHLNGGGRISGEDLRTWLLAFELHVDVYILANKFVLEGFKREIARVAIDMLETAGADAAIPEVLFLCRKLYEGLPENDALLKMVFARVGFLQPWRRAPEETQDFLLQNPEIAPMLLREMAARREEDFNGRNLPSMERSWFPTHPAVDPISPYQRAGAPHHYHHYRGPPRW